MSETKGLYSILMLALIFNTVMYGVFDFVNASGVDTIECELGDFGQNDTGVVSGQSSPTTFEGCEPAGLPFWYYAIWLIINGVLVYAFLPFVK